MLNGPMLKLSGFTDEIAPDIDSQIYTAKQLGLTHFELRSVDGVNVLKFSAEQRKAIRTKLDAAGLGTISIGSPCGKMPVDTPKEQLMDMFKVAMDMADFFGAPLIRVFSFYPPGGEGKGPIEPHRNAIIDLLASQARLLENTKLTMVHENEKGIFGDIGPRCVDLMQSINHPKLRTAFDFANFVQCGQDPLAIWPQLKPFTVHIHIKDAMAGSGQVVPAGEGDGKIAEILKDAWDGGYTGFLSLEPHLKVAGHSHGETGPELFAKAVVALRDVCKRINVPLAS
jgi:3-dehydroshikimate dehydratase